MFSAFFLHKITLRAMDIDKKRFRTPFLKLLNHFEKPSTGLNFLEQHPCHMPLLPLCHEDDADDKHPALAKLYSQDWSLIPPLFPNVFLPFLPTITFLTTPHSADYHHDHRSM